MSEIAVIYKTKYGTTEKYARWIADAVGANLYRQKDVKIKDLLPYRTIVYCGAIYAGGVLGFSLIRKNLDKLESKDIIVVAVCATTNTEKAQMEVSEQNLPPKEQGKIPVFALRGGVNYDKMAPLDRLLMSLLIKTIRKKEPDMLNDDDKGLLATYGKVIDYTRQEAIEPVVERIKRPRISV